MQPGRRVGPVPPAVGSRAHHVGDGAAIALPTVVQDNLLRAGLAHQTIKLTRVGYAGNVSTSYIDMTPRRVTPATTPCSR